MPETMLLRRLLLPELKFVRSWRKAGDEDGGGGSSEGVGDGGLSAVCDQVEQRVRPPGGDGARCAAAGHGGAAGGAQASILLPAVRTALHGACAGDSQGVQDDRAIPTQPAVGLRKLQ